MTLLISLRSETLKLRRTLALYLCILGAAFGPLMSLLEELQESQGSPKGQPWAKFFFQGREPVSIALLPLYTVLVCTLLLQIEYRDKTWKQVLSSPQKMFNVFLAKFLSLQGMILLFIVAYTFFLFVTGFITEAVHPELYDGPLSLYLILAKNVEMWLLLLGLSAIQFWLSLRFRNFITPLGIGVGGWFLAPMMIFEFKTSFVEYYPYAFTILGVMPKYKDNTIIYQWYSIAIALLFLTLAFYEFRSRKVKG